MDYKFLAERAEYSSRHAGCYSKILAECATAITDLLARAETAEARAEKAERCINDIEDDLDRGNDNDWAREHIAEYRSQKEE